jgi:predicted Rossmann fold nucleotide-binding protein DprA/Smf involved in DNA uptake
MTSAGERLAIRTLLAGVPAIGFTGSRVGMTPAQQDALRSLLVSGAGVLHYGDAVGADEQAHDIAVAVGRAVVIHPGSFSDQRAFKPAKEIRRPKKPLVRNKDIVRETAVLMAAPAQEVEQLRSGTWSTIRFARHLSRPVVIVLPDGSYIAERIPPS